MLEPVQSIERETYDFNNMSPEETAFYKEFMDEISKDWKAQQNQVVRSGHFFHILLHILLEV